MPAQETVDVLVVGAGPAGSTAAVSLLRSDPGLRVLLVDKAAFPRDKACGDGLGPGVVSVLSNLGMEDVVDGEEPIDACTIYGPDGTGFEASLPLIDGKRIMGYVIPRTVLDKRIVDHAVAAGADLRENWRFIGLGPSEAGLAVASFETPTGVRTVAAKAVVGADGANSRVRAALGVRRNSDRMTGIAVRAYAEPRPRPARSLVFEWSDVLLPAYAWVFPTSGAIANVGLGLVVKDRKQRKVNLNDSMEQFRKVLAERGSQIDEYDLTRSYILPHGARLPKMAHGRVVLIGDAASMINPLSGEGIFYGMAAGEALGGVLAGALDGEVEAALRSFEQSFRKRFVWHFRGNYIASVLMRSTAWSRIVIRAAARNEKVLVAGVELLFGEGTLRPSLSFRILLHGIRR